MESIFVRIGWMSEFSVAPDSDPAFRLRIGVRSHVAPDSDPAFLSAGKDSASECGAT
jgi:hypothetical protein